MTAAQQPAAAEAAAAREAKLARKLAKLQAAGADAAALAKAERKLAKARKAARKAAAGAVVEPVASTESGDSAPPSGAAASGGAQEGKQKKQGKKQRREAAEEQLQMQQQQPASESKKKDKKKRARGGSDGEGGDNAAAAEPAKKAKQQQQQQQQQGGGPRPLANVGDAALAAARPPLVRALYTEHASTAAMSPAEVAAFRAERRTAVEGEGADVRPVTSFAATGLPADMLHATRAFSAPSPIQAQCWPIILSGHDLIGIAATGSGKTLGFGLPMLAHIVAQRRAGVVKGPGPTALVLAPTRELAQQIAAVLEDAGSRCGVSCCVVYGGVPKPPQAAALRKGVDVVVGTPGRLEDLMQDGACRLQNVTYLVLDEADRMLDLGFEPHIRAIASTVRADRQTLMFSATWPTAVQQLAHNYLVRAAKVTIGSADLAANHSVAQAVEVLDAPARDERLLALLAKHRAAHGPSSRVIVFVLYKREAPRVEALLARRGFKAAAVHGDIGQGQRTAAVDAFKAGTTPLLIATDVAARGLDIPDVELVVNYSFPLTTEDYVHRIGRTGRAGKTGSAVTFFVPANDKARAGELINVLREAKQAVPEALLAFGTTVKKKEHSLYGAHFKDIDLNKKASKITFD